MTAVSHTALDLTRGGMSLGLVCLIADCSRSSVAQRQRPAFSAVPVAVEKRTPASHPLHMQRKSALLRLLPQVFHSQTMPVAQSVQSVSLESPQAYAPASHASTERQGVDA